jgi:hypothetical protein
VLDVECRVGKGSDDVDGEQWIGKEKHKILAKKHSRRLRSSNQVEKPIHAEHRRTGREVRS